MKLSVKPRIVFLSLNSITAIPVFRLIFSEIETSFFSSQFIIECFLEDMSSRFTKPYQHVDILKFKNARQFNNQSLLQKARKYLMILGYAIRFIKADTIIYTCDLEVLALCIFIKWIKRSRCRFVYHQFEAIERKNANFIKRLALKYLNHTTAIDFSIFPEQNRLELFKELITQPTLNSMVFSNTCYPHQHNTDNSNRKFIIGHIGNLSFQSFYLKELLVFAKMLNYVNFHFIFVGVKDKNVEKRIRETIPEAEIKGWMDHAALTQIYETLDLGLILYRPLDFNTDYCAPNKLYEYWSYGIPVFAPELKGLLPVFDSPLKGKLVNFTDLNQVVNSLSAMVKNKDRAIEKEKLCTLFSHTLAIDVFMRRLHRKFDELI